MNNKTTPPAAAGARLTMSFNRAGQNGVCIFVRWLADGQSDWSAACGEFSIGCGKAMSPDAAYIQASRAVNTWLKANVARLAP